MKFFHATLTLYFILSAFPVRALNTSSNEYKALLCEVALEDAHNWADTQRKIEGATDNYDSSFWRAYKKLVNRCKSYRNNTAKTIEKDYSRLYEAYWY